jgi:hydroxypyruvate isomerase
MTVRLSACIELLFAEGRATYPERIERAAAAGIGAVEIWSWRGKPLADMRRALRDTGVRMAAMAAGTEGPVLEPARRAGFSTGVRRAIEVAVDLGCPTIIVVAGGRAPDVPDQRQRDALVDALCELAPELGAAGVTVALEPLNTRVDHPGQLLDRTADGFAMVEAVASSSVRLLYDLYHSITMGEEPDEVLSGRLDLVQHVHVADVPGRHEPGSGSVDWARRLGALVSGGYTGSIGLEYRPTTDSSSSLRAIREVIRRLGPGPSAR